MSVALKACAITVVLLAATACSGPGSDAQQRAQAEQAQAESTAFSNDLQLWRDQRVADLTRPDGWTSLTGLHWVDPGAHYIGTDAGNGIRLTMGPGHFGMIDLSNGRLRFVPEKGVTITLDGEPMKGGVTLRADDAPAGPNLLGFDEGKGVATVIKRGERYALRVKHADAPTRAGFKGLDYWPTAQDWKVDGKFIAHPPGKTIAIANIIGTTDEVPNPGAIEFTRDGKPYRIEALDEGGEQLFLVFADRTSGHGSYPAGRFLDAPKPDVNGRVALDFNKSYNPPCAFTAFATCPLPPPENRLDLAINAGEKTYAYATP